MMLLALLLLLRLLLPLRGRSRWVHVCVRQVNVCGALMGVLAGAGCEPCCCCGRGARHVFGDCSVALAHAAADGVPCDEAAADGGAQIVVLAFAIKQSCGFSVWCTPYGCWSVYRLNSCVCARCCAHRELCALARRNRR